MVVPLVQQEVLQLLGVVHRQGGHGIEGALGALADDAGDLGELVHHRVAADVVFITDGGEIAGVHVVEGGGGDLVQSGHAEAGLAVFHNVVQQLMVAADDAAHPGAAGAEPLGDGVDEDDVLRHVVKPAHGLQGLAGIDELTVRLVADDEQIMLPGDVGDEPHLLRRQHGAGGVAGVGEHDGAGAGGDLPLDAVTVGVEVTLLRVGGDGVDGRAGEAGHGVVVGIVGLGDENLVAVVQNGGEHHQQRFAAAGGDIDFIAAVVDAQVVVIPLDGGNQLRHAGGGGVGQGGGAETLHRVEKGGRRDDVRLADVQMIQLDAPLRGGHGPGVELAHGGQAALHDLMGKLHCRLPPVRSMLRMNTNACILAYFGKKCN